MRNYSDAKIKVMIADWQLGLKKIDFCSKHNMTEYCFKVFNKELKGAGFKRDRGFSGTFKQGICSYLADIKRQEETKSPPMPKFNSPKPKAKRKTKPKAKRKAKAKAKRKAKAKPKKLDLQFNARFKRKFKRKFGRSPTPMASSDESESESESDVDADDQFVSGIGKTLAEVKNYYPNFVLSRWDAAKDKISYLDSLDE